MACLGIELGLSCTGDLVEDKEGVLMEAKKRVAKIKVAPHSGLSR